MKKYTSLLLPIVAGFLYSTGFPHAIISFGPMGVALAAFLFFYQLNLTNDFSPSKKNWISTALFLLAINLFGYYWIPYTISEFGGIFFPFNYLLSALFSLIILPHYIVFVLLLSLGKKHLKRFYTPLNLAILICLLEMIIPQQFPTHLGHSWLYLAPYLPFAPIFGVPFYSFILYWPLFTAIKVLRQKCAIKSLIPGLGLLVATAVISLLFPLTYHPEKSLEVKLVQANIGNNLKIDAEKFSGTAAQTVQELYLSLSLSGAPQVDLIIWPETAYPRLLETKEMRFSAASIPPSIAETVNKSGASLFTGGYDYHRGAGTDYLFEDQYNAAFYFATGPNQQLHLSEFYHKSQLIPFGETLPFGPFNRFLGSYIRNISFFAQGERFPLFFIKETPFIAAICYEVLFPNFIRDYLNRHRDPQQQAQFLINISNDSWYGDTIEPEQHLFLTHWRSLENQLPIIRMTNTGISSILYPDGSESIRSKKQSREVLDLTLKLAHRSSTWFQRWGYLNIIFLWIILLAARKAFFKQIVKSKES